MNSPIPAPITSLKAFDRVGLKAGESRTAQFTLPPESFRIINEKNEREIRSISFEISVGGGQSGSRKGTSNVLKAKLKLL
ncbi:MAG: fibronectin type III-like domain-contianing protein [Saprospiraceae bacterium]|nr:fibronectin type III-like domain-contianing protein [Saprospiraceae bacterium]